MGPGRIEWTLTVLARLSAMLGGLVLLALIILSVLSITGRALVPVGLGPIPGDFELVQAGTAFGIFCFLPWCQMEGGHVTVDILKRWLGPRVDALLAAGFNLLMTLAAAFILWRAYAGMQDKMRYTEVTFILQYPVWWSYAVCLPLAALFVAVSAFTVYRSLRAAFAPEPAP